MANNSYQASASTYGHNGSHTSGGCSQGGQGPRLPARNMGPAPALPPPRDPRKRPSREDKARELLRTTDKALGN